MEGKIGSVDFRDRGSILDGTWTEMFPIVGTHGLAKANVGSGSAEGVSVAPVPCGSLGLTEYAKSGQRKILTLTWNAVCRWTSSSGCRKQNWLARL